MNTDSNYFYIFAAENKDIGSMKNRKRSTLWILASIILFLAACGQRGQYNALFTQIDSLADVRPKEADSLLQTLAPAMAKATEADTMCYALLRLKTDDKLYRDITDRRDLAMRLVDYYEHHNKSLLPTALFYAGRVCADLGDASQALEYYQKTLETLPVDSNTKLHDLIHTQIGYLFNYQGFFDDAINHFQSALHWSELGHDTTAQIFNLRDIGVMYYMKNNIDSSHVYYQKALRLCLLSGKEDMRIGIMSQIARNLNMRQQYGKALEFIRPALVNADSTNISGFYSIASEAYLGVGMIDSARYYADKLCIFGNVYGKRWAYEVLMQVNGQNGNIPSAIDNLNKYKVYDDSVHRLDNAAIVKRMDAMYNYQLHQKEALKLKEANKRKQRIIWMSLLFGIPTVVALLILLLYYKDKRRQSEDEVLRQRTIVNQIHNNSKQRIAENEKRIAELKEWLTEIGTESEFQRKQLEQQVKELTCKNDLAELVNNHRNISLEMILNSNAYATIRANIQESAIMREGQWDDLHRKFCLSLPNFESTLRGLCRISEIELRICMLLKLGVSIKHISVLIGRRENSVSMATRRLFFKMFGDTPPTANLADFIREL